LTYLDPYMDHSVHLVLLIDNSTPLVNHLMRCRWLLSLYHINSYSTTMLVYDKFN